MSAIDPALGESVAAAGRRGSRRRRRRPPNVSETQEGYVKPRQRRRPSNVPRRGQEPTGPLTRTTHDGGHDWGDGKGPVHSISLQRHRRNVRTARENRNPLYNPTQQLSGAQLAQAARDLVGLEYDPQEAALDRELGNVTTQGTALAQRAGDYSNQIAANDATLVGQQAAIGQVLQQQLAANTSTAQAAVNAGQQGALDRAKADAELRGVNVADATSGVQAETQAATGRIASEGQSSGNAAAVMEAAYKQLADLSGRARGQMGQEIQGQLLNRLSNAQGDVRARQTDLATQRGQATSKATLELRQQAFENLITQGGLDIKSEDLEAETALGKARIEEQAKARRSRERIANKAREARKEADRQAATGKDNDVNKYGITNKAWRNMSVQARQRTIRQFDSSGSSRDRGRTPMTQDARNRRTRINSIVTDIENDPKLRRHRFGQGPGGPGRLVQILTKRGADPLEAQAAAEVARYGTLRPNTASKLRQAGIRIPRSWLGTPGKVHPGGNPGG